MKTRGSSVSWIRASIRALMLLSVLLAGGRLVADSDDFIPGLKGWKGPWVAMLIEDHGGMREMVWDGACTDPQVPGPFLRSHRYALQTKGSPGLVDLGCWDEAWPNGNGWRAGAPVVAVTLTKDGLGALLAINGKQTWLPLAADYDGKGAPLATFRGAYLNWLLANRPGSTPSIPKETRWQRVQRGARAVVQALLTRSGGQPEFRVVGLGTSGRLLVPPGESLSQGLNAVENMLPTNAGSMDEALEDAEESVEDLQARGGCSPGIVLPMGDGFTLDGVCGDATPYELSSEYREFFELAEDIRESGAAAIWTWSVDGPRTWSKDLATAGRGLVFQGDAVGALETAIRAWMGGTATSLQLSLGFDVTSPTRQNPVTLTIQSNRPLACLMVNGQPVKPTGLETQLLVSLKEGVNAFTVVGTDACGSQAQVSATLVLDTTAPRILLNPMPPSATNQAALTVKGSVDDPAATLTLNGAAVALDPKGAFSAPVQLKEGANALAFVAKDLAGNAGTLNVAVALDTRAPKVVLDAPLEGLVTNAATLAVKGHVDDPASAVTVNGQALHPDASGAFSLSLAPAEGPLTITALATDSVGNVGKDERHVLIDRTAPKIALNPVPPSLTNVPSLVLAGSVDDPKALLKINGNPVILDAKGAFSASVALSEGTNTLLLSAVDAAGNEGRLSVPVQLDTTAPAVRLTQPAEGLVTNAHSLTVAGSVDDPKAAVKVNGLAAAVDATGAFSLVLPLSVEGSFTVEAVAQDLAGNVGKAARKVTADWTAPVITLNPVPPVRTSSAAYTFTGKVDDPAAILALNGKGVSLGSGGSFSLPVTLVEGSNAFAFEATDAAGNKGQLGLSLILDTVPPKVTLEAPAEGLVTNAATLLVQGHVDDVQGTLTVNGQTVRPDATGAFSLTLTPAEGPLTITALAKDSAGNTGKDERHVLVDRTAPKITLNPVPASLVNTPGLLLQGTVDDPKALFKLNGSPVALDARGAFSFTAALVEGANTLALSAVDAAGNEGKLSVSVTRDTVAPVVRILQPAEGSATNLHSLTVTGQVDDPGAKVWLNAQAVVVDAKGAWSLTLPLSGEGPLTLEATAQDAATNSSKATRKILVDWTAPIITLNPPPPVRTATAAQTLAGKVDDPTATLTVNGQPIALNAQGAFSLPVTLAEGSNAYAFVALDAAGNKGSLGATITLDTTAPKVTLEAPAEGLVTNAPTLDVRGRVDDPSCTLTLNGQAVKLDATGAFALSLSPAEGALTLAAVATDAVGNVGRDERHVLVDRTAPVITLNPPPPSLLSATSYLLAGQVDDPKAVLKLNGAVLALDAQGGFSTTLPLVEGPNAFALSALDAAGNEGRAQVSITRDTVAPVVRLTQPSEGLVTNQKTLTVAGQVDDLTAQVRVNDQPVSLDSAGRFSLVLSLASEGSLTLAITAADAAANVGKDSRRVVVDWTAPVITLNPPPPVRTATAAQTLAGKVDDASAVLTANGQPVALSAQGTFSLPVTLVEGANTFAFLATDAAGNKGALSASITLDTTAPKVTLEAPAEGLATNAATLEVRGHVDDPAGTLSVNGQAVKPDAAGAFSLILSPPEGPLTILAVATDALGNVGRDERHVLVDRTPPKIVLNPPPPSLVSATSLILTGTVDDPKATLRVDGNAVPLDAQGAFSTSLRLLEGPNTFALSATDAAGNATPLSVAVVRDTLPPVLRLDQPVEGFLTNAKGLKVAGQVDDLSAKVWVNGQAVPVDASGAFALTLPLAAEGPATVEVVAQDPAANTAKTLRKGMVDWTAPVITLSPQPPTRTATAAQTLAGKVDDPTAILTVNGQPVTLGAQGAFSLPITLVEGANAYAFAATDAAGNKGVLSASITLDTTAPKLILDAPIEGLITNAATLEVRGRVDDPAAALTVNGQAVKPDAAGAFVLVLSPAEGPLTVQAVATDALGNASREERHVVVDRTAPRVSLNPPPPGLVSVPSLVITGSVDDPKATLTLNGASVVLDAQGAFSASLTLAEGTNALAFVARDAAGNEGRLQVPITCDTHAPLVRITQPAGNLVTNGHSLLVAGQVDDPSAKVWVNGQAVAVDGSGAFSLTLALGAEGPLVIEAVAQDAAANTAKANRVVTVDWTAPVITFAPQPPARTGTSAQVINGRVDDPTAILTANGQAIPLNAQGAFSLPITLVEGPNTYAFLATDAAGNRGQASLVLVLDTTAPKVSIDAPADGLVTNAATLEVRGRVDDPAGTLKINGQAVSLDASGNFSLSLSPAEGPLTITAVATASLGNVGRDERHVVIDRTAPRIALSAAPPSLTNNPSVLIQGRVDDPTATLTANGATLALGPDGAFQWPASLAEGANTLLLTAQDAAGNASSLTVGVVLDTQPPAVVLTAPTEGLRTNAAQVLVQGQVNDPTATVSVNGQVVSLIGGTFALSLSPAEGPLTILAVATDAAGNSSQDVRHVVVARTAPKITLVRPVPALVNLSPLTLQGLVDNPAARLTLNGQAVALDAQGAFSVDAPLQEGANAFHFEAVDATGNVGVLDARTLLDSTPPVITLESPAEGLITNQHTVLVKGRVDDPTARLQVSGQSLTPQADGSFEFTLSPAEGSQLVVVLATDAAGNTGHAVRSVILDWTPPALAWLAPTPAEGSKAATLPLSVAASVSESATVKLNGQALTLENGSPFQVKSTLSPVHGPVVLSLEATDAAGNVGRIERRFDVGTAAPVVVIEGPAEGFQTQNASAVLIGRVEGPDSLKPLSLTLNGAPAALGADGRFSLPVQLQEGANAFRLAATNAFGIKGQADRTLNRFTTPFGVDIDWPLEGLATPESSVEVRGHLRRPGASVTVNGLPATVEPGSLGFRVVVPLSPGPNTLTAQATDGAGNQGQAQVHLTCVPPADPAATYRWDLPLNGAVSKSRTVKVAGQADLPGVASVKVNGLPLSLSGTGKDGHFEGDLSLDGRGHNVLYLEVRTLAGATLTERREVNFAPELPRIRLQAPESARAGDVIPVQVSPEVGTRLQAVDLSWNGRLLGRITDPFAPTSAQVPADAAVGSRILLEALGTDLEGEQVTARTYVTVYGQGALLVEAYDDRLGLPLKEGQAEVEGGEVQALDAKGRAALRTALPQNWIKMSRGGFTPVWRPAALQVGGVQSVVDARLTATVPGQALQGAAFAGDFGNGALHLSFPALTGTGTVAATPLSTQGLPALLPAGWSAVSAWWVDLSSLGLAAPGSAALKLPAGAPGEGLAWVRWDAGLHLWMTLASGLRTADLSNLSLPVAGGYALVAPDPGPTAPSAAVAGAQVPAYEGAAWRDGLLFTGGVDPDTLPTSAAIQGARATAKFSLGFGGKDPLPSGLLIQTDVLESYALLDSALIEPDGFSQDAVAARWILGVGEDGVPTLRAAQDLGLELPVRMSRTFQASELVEGRIWVGFYHDGVQVAQSGSELLDASGGLIAHDGIEVTVPAGALQGTTLFRLNADPGDASPLWSELAGKGGLLKSFQLDVVGALAQGLHLHFADLGPVPTGGRPLLLQRRVVQGERVLAALGELSAAASGWDLRIPTGGSPILEGGSFAVLLPSQVWDWVSGRATAPAGVAGPLLKRLGQKARLMPLATSRVGTGATPAGDAGVADVMVDAGLLKAVSAADGAFAVPAPLPDASSSATVLGERRDLGLRGRLTAAVPSQDQVLAMAQAAFQVLNVSPAEGAEVGSGSVVEIQLSTAADPATVASVKLFRELPPATPSRAPAATLPQAKIPAQGVAKPIPAKRTRKGAKSALVLQGAAQVVEVSVRRTLSQDGRTLLLTPEAPLPLGSAYQVATLGLASPAGEAAPAFTRRFRTQSQPSFPDVDLSRIKVSYPTASLDVTVTIPEGALAPWTVVEVEALEMGSYATGVMPPKGDLVFSLKANLGERLKVTVQMMDGRSFQGTIGRYVADDGRTTVGADGGRVEGPGGLAIVVPPGALAGPVELTVETMTTLPTLAEGAVMDNERVMKGLRIRTKDTVRFQKPPVFELPLSVLADGVDLRAGDQDFGNGPLGLFRTEQRTLPDGTVDEYSVLMDTAEVRDTPQGKKIVSFGGLRVPDPAAGVVVQAPGFSIGPRGGSAQAKAGLGVPNGTAKHFATEGSDVEWSPSFDGIYLWGFWLPSFDPGPPPYRYHSGTVYRNWNGLGRCGGTASASCYGELPAAEVHRYSGTVGLDAARQGRLARGRMLAVCDDQGRYVSVGGPMASAIPGQTWIALFAVDPRTGETSIDPGALKPTDLGLPWGSRNHSLVITSTTNPFDPTLTAPRLRAKLVDATGTERAVFAVGEQATLKIFTEAGSQPVVRGKVSGSLTSTFGALPTELPVTFNDEGSWKVDIAGWTAKPVEGDCSLSLVVTPAGQLGPSLPGKPLVVSKDPEDGDREVDPFAVVKVAFNEPIRPDKSLFHLYENGAEVAFTLLSQGREATPDRPAQELWMVPNHRFGLGSKVGVLIEALLDTDATPSSLDPIRWNFTVRSPEELPSLSSAGSFSAMVAHKGKLYAFEKVGESHGGDFDVAGVSVQSIRMIDVSDPSSPRKGNSFGCHGSWDPMGALYTSGFAVEPFYKHELNGLRVAEAIGVNGAVRDLLLVLSRPRQATEMWVWSSDGQNEYRSRHNTLWVFDITGDGDSLGENGTPKLLMVTSLGSLTENWGKGLGSAGGMLGVVRLRGGLSIWDAGLWQSGFVADARALESQGAAFNGQYVLARRARTETGYYPDASTIVAANLMGTASGPGSSVLSAVICDGEDGKPWVFAAKGYAEGKLYFADPKVGEPEAKATYVGGGLNGLDGRLTDLSFAVNNQQASLVETMKGSWKAQYGSDTGTLLLVATQSGDTGHLWVLKPTRGSGGDMGVQQLGLADLPGRATTLKTDPQGMMVAVGLAGGKVLAFDLKNLSGGVSTPLIPVFTSDGVGAFTLSDSFLFSEGSSETTVRIRNLSPEERVEVDLVDPQWIDIPGKTRDGSGLSVHSFMVQLVDGQDRPVAAMGQMVRLRECSWITVSGDGGTPLPANDPSLLAKRFNRLTLFLSSSLKQYGNFFRLKIWGGDLAGNGFRELSYQDFLAGKPTVLTIRVKGGA